MNVNSRSGQLTFAFAFGVAVLVVDTVPPSTRMVAAVYDASGALVRELTHASMSGSGSIAWDGRTQAGERAPAGVYFVHLQAGAVRETKKVVLLR
jgi:flagellar hook assembly protein FlgD